MAERHTVTTLRRKRDEILHSIQLYERRIEQARADLVHIAGAIRLFQIGEGTKDLPCYVDVQKLFKRGESFVLCKQALTDGVKTTRELTQHLMKAKGLDTADKVMARTIGFRLVQMLRAQWRRKGVVMTGKRHGANLWRLPDGDAASSQKNQRTDLFSRPSQQDG